MFTGLIEETGRVAWLRRSSENGLQLQVAAPGISRGLHTGESIAVNGCCLTVSSHRAEMVAFNLLQETLDRTNLGRLRPDSSVNLERALAAGDRFGGHIVQGHVDCTAAVLAWDKKGDDYRLEIALPEEFAHYVIYKGSIAINGISLTVASVGPGSLTAWIIPHTRQNTSLQIIKPGDLVNLEFDQVAKYLERLFARYQQPPAQFTDQDLSQGNSSSGQDFGENLAPMACQEMGWLVCCALPRSTSLRKQPTYGHSQAENLSPAATSAKAASLPPRRAVF